MKTSISIRLGLTALAVTLGTLLAQQGQSQGPGSPVQGSPSSPVAQPVTPPGPITAGPGPVTPVPADNPAERLQLRSQLSLELGLSASQDAQIERIRERQRAEIAAINQNSGLTQEQYRAQIAATVQKYAAEINALLTPDQLRIMDQIRDRDRDRLQTMLGDNLAERLQVRSRATQELGLSEQQLGQIERIREQQRAEIAAMNQNQTMTQEQRLEQYAAALRKYGDQVRGVLNQDQIQKWEQMRVRERERLRTMQADNIAELLQRRSELSRQLGLSAEQEAELARIRERQRAEIAAMNQNQALTQEQRREQIAAAIRNYGDQVRAVLKEDQLKQLDQIRAGDWDRDRDRTRDRKRVDRPGIE